MQTQRELALETELLELQQHGTVPGLNSPIQKLITLFCGTHFNIHRVLH